MKTRIDFLAAGMFLASLVNGFGQPVITRQPQSVTNLAGTTATFFVTATGTPPLAYQWLFNSTIALANATNADLILTNVQSVTAGGYSVVVTNVEGVVPSAVATLTVLTPPTFIRQPANQTASLFADASFRVTVNGDAPLSLFSKLNNVVANPAQYGFTKSNISALDDTTHTNKTFNGPGADYVFWDSLHPTSKLQALMWDRHLACLRVGVPIYPRQAGSLSHFGIVRQFHHVIEERKAWRWWRLSPDG